jgi:ribokinase
VGESFARSFSGYSDLDRAAKSLRKRPTQYVIITRGSKGCAAYLQNETFRLPAVPVQALDTTGCGDVFHGAYALAISRTHTILDATRFASVAAALSARSVGGRDGIPTLGEVEKVLLDW